MFDYLKLWLTTRMPKDEKGQDLSEYALLIGLIALVVFLAVTFLGQEISTLFSQLGYKVSTWGPF